MAQTDQTQLSDYRIPPRETGEKSSGCGKLTLGCGIGALVVVLLIGGGVAYLIYNFKSLAVSWGSAAATSAVQGSNLPSNQKQRIVSRIKRVKKDYLAGRIADQQMGRIFKNLTNLLPAGVALSYQQQYVKPSKLSPEEKQAADRTLQRFARGIYNGSIEERTIQDVSAPISRNNQQGKKQLKQQPSEAELRRMLQVAKKKADQAKVPDEPFHLNIADEVDKAVKQAMSQPGQTTSQTPPHPQGTR